jgi:hypothetical protein
LLFRSPGNGKLAFMKVGEMYADHMQIHVARKHLKLMPTAQDIIPRIRIPLQFQYKSMTPALTWTKTPQMTTGCPKNSKPI